MSRTARRPRPDRRSAAVVVGLTLAGLPLLAACGAVPPGAAAIVGGDRLSQATLRNAVTTGLADPDSGPLLAPDRSGYQTRVLSLRIRLRLDRAAAARYGVSVPQSDIDAFYRRVLRATGSQQKLAQAASDPQQGLGLSLTDLADYSAVVVTERAVGDRLVADQPVSDDTLRSAYAQTVQTVTVSHVLLPDKALATKVAAQIRADPASLPALVNRYSLDTQSKESGGKLGTFTRSRPPQDDPAFVAAAFSAPAGSVVGPVKVGSYYDVLRIDAVSSPPFDSVKADLRRRVLADQIKARLPAALQTSDSATGVRVSPRFGSWVEEQRSVNPEGGGPGSVVTRVPDPTAGPLAPPGGSASGA